MRQPHHPDRSSTPPLRVKRGGTPRIAAAAVCVLLGGCAWHRVEPRLDRSPPERVRESVGLAAADAETSLADLQTIARLWSSWQAFSHVEFPFRHGDSVDVVVELKLRQRVDGHRASNMLRAAVAGLSLGLLTPVIGVRISEIHDVTLRCRRAPAAATMPVELQVRTDVEMGVMANGAAAAKSLDDEHLKRVASQAFLAFVSTCSVRDRSLHEPGSDDVPQR